MYLSENKFIDAGTRHEPGAGQVVVQPLEHGALAPGIHGLRGHLIHRQIMTSLDKFSGLNWQFRVLINISWLYWQYIVTLKQ